jgi:hypothetical protein
MASDKVLISLYNDGVANLPASRNQWSLLKVKVVLDKKLYGVPHKTGSAFGYGVKDFEFTKPMNQTLYPLFESVHEYSPERPKAKQIAQDYTKQVAKDITSHKHGAAKIPRDNKATGKFEAFARYNYDPPHKGGINYTLYAYLSDPDPPPSSDDAYRLTLEERKNLSDEILKKKKTGKTLMDKEWNSSAKMSEHAEKNYPSCTPSSLDKDTVYKVRCPTDSCSFLSSYIGLLKRFHDNWGSHHEFACAQGNHSKWGNRCTGKFHLFRGCALAQNDKLWNAPCCLNNIGWGMNRIRRKGGTSYGPQTLHKFQEGNSLAAPTSDANPFQRSVVCDGAHPPVLKEHEQTACYLLLPSKKNCAARENGAPLLLESNTPCLCNWYRPLWKFMHAGGLRPSSSVKTQLAALSQTAKNYCQQISAQGDKCCQCLTHRPFSCNGGPCVLYTVLKGKIHPVQPMDGDTHGTISVTDYVCAYAPCAGGGIQSQLTTMQMEKRKETCPQKVCFQILTDYTLQSNDVCGGQGIYIGNASNFCSGGHRCKSGGVPRIDSYLPEQTLIGDRSNNSQGEYEMMYELYNSGAPKSVLCPRIKSIDVTSCPKSAPCYTNNKQLPHWLRSTSLSSTRISPGERASYSLFVTPTEMHEGHYTVKVHIHDPFVKGETIERTFTAHILIVSTGGDSPPSPGGKVPPHRGGAHLIYKNKSRPVYSFLAIGLALFALVFIAIALYTAHLRKKDAESHKHHTLEHTKEKIAAQHGIDLSNTDSPASSSSSSSSLGSTHPESHSSSASLSATALGTSEH